LEETEVKYRHIDTAPKGRTINLVYGFEDSDILLIEPAMWNSVTMRWENPHDPYMEFPIIKGWMPDTEIEVMPDGLDRLPFWTRVKKVLGSFICRA
jgi:hypothetical protein